MSRRRRHSGSGFSSKGKIKQRRRKGWDMNLYRNTDDKKIAGVCAGLADHFDVAHWVVRLIFVAGFLFTGSLAFFAYGAAWCLMAPKREEYSEEAVEYDEHRKEYKPRSMFRYSENASARIKAAQERVRSSMGRIEGMESYVTSRQYKLNKEFSKLAD
ncbi:MAG: PspC domain-containing protein [Oceanicoccus sp.]